MVVISDFLKVNEFYGKSSHQMPVLVFISSQLPTFSHKTAQSLGMVR